MSADPHRIPFTVDDAVSILISEMDEEAREIVRSKTEDDLWMYHHGFGTMIRNRFRLWIDNQLLLKDAKAEDPDDASMTIIVALWKRLREMASTNMPGLGGKDVEV